MLDPAVETSPETSDEASVTQFDWLNLKSSSGLSSIAAPIMHAAQNIREEYWALQQLVADKSISLPPRRVERIKPALLKGTSGVCPKPDFLSVVDGYTPRSDGFPKTETSRSLW